MEDPQSAEQAGIIVQQGLSKFLCTLCQVTFTPTIQSHIFKDSHRNILSWEAVNNASASPYLLRSLPEVIRSAKQSGDIQALDKSRFSYECKVCSGKKPFFGLQPLQDHLKGKDHTKMKTLIQMTSATRINTTSSNPSTQKELIPDSTASDLHPEVKTLLRNKTVQIKENNGITTFICLVCNNLPMTGVQPLMQHIEGMKHKKNEKQKALVPDSQELPQPPESMECSSPDSSQDQLSSDIPQIIYPSSPVSNDSNTYKNLSLPRGLVYIFNNTFSGKLRLERSGSKKDPINLAHLFSNMGYKVKLCPDMSKKIMFEKLSEIQIEPELKSVDCLIIIIMSHGDTKDERRFFTNDMEPIELDEVRYKFTDSQCPVLIGKPKIFLSNFCRGELSERPTPILDLESDAPINYAGKDAPRDMCTIHASISGFEAKRHPEDGTVFAQSLCSVLSQHSHNTEMADLYRELCRHMIKKTGTTPEQQNYFFLRFYFNPTPVLAASTM